MIGIVRHDDVVQLRMSSRRSRLMDFSVSAYLVRGVLVDCGFPAVEDEFSRFLQAERLEGVLVTHYHEDHAGNIEAVARRGIPIAAHHATLTYARSPKPLALYRRFTWGVPRPLVSPVIPFDPDGVMMIHAPGHSADHHVVWDPSTATLFASDLFLGVRVRLSHANEEPRRLVASLRRVLALEPRRVFDAHRGLVADPRAMFLAKIAWMEELIGRVERLSADGMSADRIARTVLGRRGVSDIVSEGEYSRANLVHAILRESA